MADKGGVKSPLTSEARLKGMSRTIKNFDFTNAFLSGVF